MRSINIRSQIEAYGLRHRQIHVDGRSVWISNGFNDYSGKTSIEIVSVHIESYLVRILTQMMKDTSK